MPTYHADAKAEGIWTVLAGIVGAAVASGAVAMGVVDEGSSAVIAGAVTGAIAMGLRWLAGHFLPEPKAGG